MECFVPHSPYEKKQLSNRLLIVQQKSVIIVRKIVLSTCTYPTKLTKCIFLCERIYLHNEKNKNCHFNICTFLSSVLKYEILTVSSFIDLSQQNFVKFCNIFLCLFILPICHLMRNLTVIFS